MSKMVVLSRPQSLPDCSESNLSNVEMNGHDDIKSTELSPDKKVQIMKRPSNQYSEGGRAVLGDGSGQVKSYEEREADYNKARSRILGSSKTNGPSPPTSSTQQVSPPTPPSSIVSSSGRSSSSSDPAVSPPDYSAPLSPPSSGSTSSLSPPSCTAPPASMLPQPEGWCTRPQCPPYTQFLSQPYPQQMYQASPSLYQSVPPNMMAGRMMVPCITSQLPQCYQQHGSMAQVYQPSFCPQPPVFVHSAQSPQMYGMAYGAPPMSNQAPPLHNQAPPMHSQAPPMRSQAPPMSHGSPSMSQSAMMSYVDAPVFQPKQVDVANVNSNGSQKWTGSNSASAKENPGNKKPAKDASSESARGALKIRLKNGKNNNNSGNIKGESSTGKTIEILKRKSLVAEGEAAVIGVEGAVRSVEKSGISVEKSGISVEESVNSVEKTVSEENGGTTKPKEKKKRQQKKKKSQVDQETEKTESDEVKENDAETTTASKKKPNKKATKQKTESVNVRNAKRNPLAFLRDINRSANDKIVRVPRGPDGTSGFNLVRDFSCIGLV